MAAVEKVSAEMTDQIKVEYIDENKHSATTSTTHAAEVTPESIPTTASSGTVIKSEEPEYVPTNTSSSSSGTITKPTNPTKQNQPNARKDNHQRKRSNDKKTEDTKGTSKRTHIIIITSLVCTFVGSASGLIVLYSHLNEKDARQVIESRFRQESYHDEPTATDKCQMETRSAVQSCFNASDYFEEEENQEKCIYLESVGECVMERSESDNETNCSELVDILQSFQLEDSLFNIAEAYLQIDVRQCSFYNGSAVASVMEKGHTT
ncbi:uncharacterized protein LOC117339279 [Pecten maximus]|uniref:uncharacterized protein LOC117339279 n=1 Tax=Pecten maximus TaxID=6579 RepID=UPI001458A175|nr:uncharacterized protein LOC117339279 [Pecten maximus]